ncbi:membrane-associated proteins in eicosanoid and glutathione metabolism [Annulohypoxylon maeteangense]|uniref:membrane-associated proteins in eicosanoid and glutathione metabolism n=1 Tax=Annulohypoxylon maeteangense TaxID=1927788 RepID=UPI002007730C|nr:membrane-associated proteins in eicosanoid and glutathione metabolism [Annulohypoxylon maeteangense]KAI0881179.1 membrane-associated proteins in eicosanoid and glutathione metabolism [Annulohypoxylon maeteangense]
MASSFQVPGEYGYVLTVAASSFFINTLHFVLTAKARKASGLGYPIPYASKEHAEKDPKAYAFNCAQRAHANYTENLTPFLGALLISGLYYPTASAALGATWVFGRFWYALGYTSFGPQGRLKGFTLSVISDTALKIMAVIAGVKMLPSA